MKITLDLTDLVTKGQLTQAEAGRLKGLAIKDTGALGVNILMAFGALAVSLGIGILVPFAVIATMFVGGVIGVLWKGGDRRSYDRYMIPLASGFIAGEALVAVIAPLLFQLGFEVGPLIR